LNPLKQSASNFEIAKKAFQSKRYSKAMHFLDYTILHYPDDDSSNYIYGCCLYYLEDFERSVEYLDRVSSSLKKKIFWKLQRIKSYIRFDSSKAIKYILDVLDNHSGQEELYYSLANLYQNNNAYDEAIIYYKKILYLDDKNFLVYNNIANCYKHKGEYSKSILMFKKSIYFGKSSSISYSNLGALYVKLKRYDSAYYIYKQGINSHDDIRSSWNLSLLKLLFMDYKAGFLLYENRFRIEEFRSGLLTSKKWRGESLNDKIILISKEQGFGDIIMFARYIYFIIKLMPKKIILNIPQTLHILFTSISDSIEMIDDDIINNENIIYDYQIQIMSLAYIFGTTYESIFNTTPYLSPIQTNQSLEKNFNIDDTKFNIIIAHKSFNNKDSEYRSITLEHICNIFNIPNVQFYSILKDEDTSKYPNIINLSNQINDFNDTSNLISKIDLVISIDTALAHLSGAMGKPCFTILPYASNWRWGIDEYSLWYPTIRLFRANKKGHQELSNNLENAIIQMINYGFTTKVKMIDTINTSNIITNHKDLDKLNQEAINLFHQKEFEKSMTLSIQSLKIEQTIDAFMNLALIHIELKKYKDSILYLKECNYISISNEAYFYLGVNYKRIQDIEHSISSFKQAISINPNDNKSKQNLASIYTENEMYDLAIDTYKSMEDENLTARFLGVIYHKMQDKTNTRKYYKILETQDINDIEAINIAIFYYEDNDLIKAKTYANKSLSIKENSKSLQLLGSIHRKNKQFKKAILSYEKALKLDTKDMVVLWNLGFLYLILEEYIKGFEFLEKRYDSNLIIEKQQFKSPKYNNQDLQNKTIFIHSEQGLGDNIIFARYIPLIKEKYPNSKIYTQVDKSLSTIFSSIHQIDKIFTTKDIEEDYDYNISFFSLAYVFKTIISTIPYKFPYLKAIQKQQDLKVNKTKFNIAISWECYNLSDTYLDRSINVSYFECLNDNPNIQLYQIQKNPSSKFATNKPKNIIDLSSKLISFNETANIINQMDLTITIDTSIAHLCGAMNAQCFVIVPHNTNWRWGLSKNTTPWYKSIKIFRMNDDINKQKVFLDIKIAVDKIIKGN